MPSLTVLVTEVLQVLNPASMFSSTCSCVDCHWSRLGAVGVQIGLYY